MEATVTRGFLRFFSELPDPRTGRCITHKLNDLLVIGVLAILCGADGWVNVALWARCKHKWLSTFLDLPGGIPSHDTFGRVFGLLDPLALERCFLAWMASVVELSSGTLISIDGKAIRRSFEHAWDKSGMSHLLSAFVSQGNNRLVFSQLAVEDKQNEIVAIPRLLELLDLKGAVVSIDAMGTQREIAGKIIEGGGDYVLPVKDNQPALAAKVQAAMDEAVLDHQKQTPDVSVDYFQHSQQGHGRLETRQVWLSHEVSALGSDLLGLWPGMSGIALVQRTRQDLGDYSGKVSVERCCYILSSKDASASDVAGWIRGHWSVENNLHWQLDVSFGEDQNRIRQNHAAENYSRLCRIALNLLKSDDSIKVGIKGKRLNAGWDNDYLLHLINQ